MEFSLVDRKVWLVDKDTEFVKEAASIFSDAGFRFRSFSDGHALMGHWHLEEHPDLILIGFNAEDRMAIEIVRSMRALDEDVALIVLSPNNSDSTALNLLKAGADDILTKSIPVSLFLARIVWHIERVESMSMLRQQMLDFRMLKELSTLIRRQEDLPTVLRALVTALQTKLRTHSTTFFLADLRTGELYRALQDEVDESANRPNLLLDLRNLPRIADAVVAQEVAYLDPEETVLLLGAMGGRWRPGTQSSIIFPLVFKKKLDGILVITSERHVSEIRERYRYLCAIIADFAAISIHRARLFDSIRQEHLRVDHTNRELQKARGYFSKLIMASPDGIVASDHTGTIFVMNTAAQKILGYGLNESIGMHVREIYPQGGAERIRHFIRSPEFGGVGVLEHHRCELLDKYGRLIPVEISASIVFEEWKEAATVGFFVDLRQRLEMQEQLQDAHESLAKTQRKALVAELAGSAAHELNQPLTGLMGYVELLERKLGEKEEKLVTSITQESNRIAEIVRKFGAITDYKTKLYVSGARIVDLDLSSEVEEVEEVHNPEIPAIDLLDYIPTAVALVDEKGQIVQMNHAARNYLNIDNDVFPKIDLKGRITSAGMRNEDEFYMSDVRILGAKIHHSSLAVKPLENGFFRVIFEIPTAKTMAPSIRILEVLSSAMHHVGLIKDRSKILELVVRCFHDVFPDYAIFIAKGSTISIDSSPYGKNLRPNSSFEFAQKGHLVDKAIMRFSSSERAYQIKMHPLQEGWIQIEKEKAAKFGVSEREAFETFAQQVGFILGQKRGQGGQDFEQDALPLINYVDALIAVCDNRRRVLVSNATFDELVNEPVMGRDILDYFDSDAKEKLRRAIAMTLAKGEAEPFNAVLYSSDRRGVNLRIRVHRNPVSIAGGNPQGFVLIGQQTEQSLLDLDARMERAEQLVSLGQLATGVAHELKNPLTSILNYADYLHQKYADSLFDAKDSERLGRIITGVEQIDGFIKDLVSLARPEKSLHGVVSLLTILSDAISMCGVLIERHEVKINFDVEWSPKVRGNDVHLRQVFVNLITNAASAMPESGGEITIRLKKVANEVVCIVSDNAIGISPDVLERIFEPFFTTRAGHGGSGLGLAIVQQIIKQHNGNIKVRSVVGEGTVFEVHLMLVESSTKD